MIRMRWVVDPYVTVPYYVNGDTGLVREVDAVPSTPRTLPLGVVREGQAEVGSKIHHLFVADGTSGSAVGVPIGSMNLNRETQQALSCKSSFGVCSGCAAMDESRKSMGLFEDFSHGDEQSVGIV
jgi:hypothetical protein